MISDGGPAFPRPASIFEDRCFPPAEGMMLRDYFAAKAMPALLRLRAPANSEGKTLAEYVAGVAYLMADAMLKERISRG